MGYSSHPTPNPHYHPPHTSPSPFSSKHLLMYELSLCFHLIFFSLFALLLRCSIIAFIFLRSLDNVYFSLSFSFLLSVLSVLCLFASVTIIGLIFCIVIEFFIVPILFPLLFLHTYCARKPVRFGTFWGIKFADFVAQFYTRLILLLLPSLL